MRRSADQNSIVLEVNGMTCGGCARAVENALAQVPGVFSVRVDLPAKRAHVEGGGLDPAKLVEAVEEAGFTATPAGA